MSYVKKEYEQSDAVRQAQAAYQNRQDQKPGEYQSRYQSQMDSLLGRLSSRDPFSYDPGTDALYKQYRDQYVRQGKYAMLDTLAQASALTGGYANSYAQTAGQQTYQGYLQGLNDRIPELYALALERYRMEGDDLQSQYALLSQQEGRDYDRYRDLLSDWNAETGRLYQQYLQERSFDYDRYSDEQDFAYSQYRDSVGDSQWQASFDYEKQADQLSYEQWLREFEYQKAQDQLAYDQWLREFQEDQRRYDQEWAAQQAAAAAKGSRGGSSSSSGAKQADSDDTRKARNFVENMLNGATSSKFDPERIISGTNALTEAQKQEAQAYLKLVLAAGRMK